MVANKSIVMLAEWLALLALLVVGIREVESRPEQQMQTVQAPIESGDEADRGLTPPQEGLETHKHYRPTQAPDLGLQGLSDLLGLEQGFHEGLKGLQGLHRPPGPPVPPGLQQRRPFPKTATIQLTVPSMDVEALNRFLRSHYRKFWMRMFPVTHSDGEVHELGGPSPRCDADECYSSCYLAGYSGGGCRRAEDRCRCQTKRTTASVRHGEDEEDDDEVRG